MTDTEQRILETPPISSPDYAARFAVRFMIYTRDQGMSPEEAVIKALEDEGTTDRVDIEKLIELLRNK